MHAYYNHATQHCHWAQRHIDLWHEGATLQVNAFQLQGSQLLAKAVTTPWCLASDLQWGLHSLLVTQL